MKSVASENYYIQEVCAQKSNDSHYMMSHLITQTNVSVVIFIYDLRARVATNIFINPISTLVDLYFFNLYK